MPRKALPPDQVRKTRVMLYLTRSEYDALHEAANRERRDMTDVLRHALEDYQARLSEPGPAWKQAERHRIMAASSVEAEGYACANAHTFWVDRRSPVVVHQCPYCGSQDLSRTWNGLLTRPTAPISV